MLLNFMGHLLFWYWQLLAYPLIGKQLKEHMNFGIILIVGLLSASTLIRALLFIAFQKFWERYFDLAVKVVFYLILAFILAFSGLVEESILFFLEFIMISLWVTIPFQAEMTLQVLRLQDQDQTMVFQHQDYHLLQHEIQKSHLHQDS